MDLIRTIVTEQTVRQIGWVLVHFLWQGVVLMILFAVILKLLRQAAPNTRYAAACAGLGLMLLAPIVTFAVIGSDSPAPVMIDTVPSTAPPAPALEPPVTSRTVVLTAETASSPKPTSLERLIDRLEAALPVFVWGWIFGVAVLSLWYLGGWYRLQRLRRTGITGVADKVIAQAGELADRLGIRQVIRVAESAHVLVPTVIGWLKPMILLPATAVTGLDEVQLKAMIAHELAHIKRCDYLVNILQTVIEILGFYQPAVWWLSGRIRIERENCCDDIAVGLLQNRKEYARALFSMETIRTKQHDLAVAATGAPLTGRIGRLLDGTTPSQKPNSGWIPFVVTFALVVALVTAAAYTAQFAARPGEKVLQFPTDYAIGEIYLQRDHPEQYAHDFNPFNDLDSWRKYSTARGTVTLPASKRIRLILFSDAWSQPEKLETLKQLKPDDLHSLVLSTNWSPGKPATDRCIPYITHLTGLKQLDLCDAAVTHNGLKQLAALSELQHLTLPQNLSNAGLAAVTDIKSLQSLRFRKNRVSDKAFSLLAKLPNLRLLCLYGDNLTDAGLAHLRDLPRLEYLSLAAGKQPFSPEGYAAIADIPNLRALWIDTHTCTDANLHPFRNHPTLEVLSLHWESNITDRGIDYLSTIPQLKLLDAQNARSLTDRSLASISRLPNLEYLAVSDFTDAGVRHLAGLKNLNYLWIGCSSLSPLTDDALDTIVGLENLQSLHIGGRRITDAGIRRIAPLKQLRELSIFESDITDESLEVIAGLSRLERLNLMPASRFLTVDGLNRLNHLENLISLSCHKIRKDDHVLNLSGLKHLDYLYLYLNNPGTNDYAAADCLEDADMQGFASLENLSFFAVGGVRITDAGLRYLSGLKYLQILQLYGPTEITDRGLQAFDPDCLVKSLRIRTGCFTDEALTSLQTWPNLQMLTLHTTDRFSPTAIHAFKQARSDLYQVDIVNADDNTGGAEKIDLHAEDTLQKSGNTPVTQNPAWTEAFYKLYRLDDRQVLKRIAPPFIPEREEYYVAEHASQAELIAEPPDYFTFHWDGELKNWGLGFMSGANTLGRVLRQSLSIPADRFEGPDALLNLPVSGDWIVRQDASDAARLYALETILQEQLGRQITFEKRTVVRPVIVARGTYRFSPPSGTYNDRQVHFYSDALDANEGAGGGTADTVAELIAVLGQRTGITVIDETANGSQAINQPYGHHRSSRIGNIDDQTQRALLDRMLRNLEKQTHLTFTVEQRPIEKWFVTDAAQPDTRFGAPGFGGGFGGSAPPADEIVYPDNWDEILAGRDETTASPPSGDPNAMRIEIYNVARLIVPANSVDDAAGQLEQLRDTITASIAPDTWTDHGGTGRVDILNDTKLIVRQTSPVHEKIHTFLEKLEETKYKYQISIETRLMMVPDFFLDNLGVDPAKSTGNVIEGFANSQSIRTVLESKPLLDVQVPLDDCPALDDLQSSFVLRAAQAERNVKTLTAPKVCVLNNEPASLEVSQDVAYTDIDDRLKNVTQGIALRLCPVVREDAKGLLLNGRVLLSNVLENRVQQRNDTFYEIPYMQVAEIPIRAHIKNRETILITGPVLTSAEKITEHITTTRFRNYQPRTTNKQRLLILIKPTIIEQEEQEAPAGGMLGGGFGGSVTPPPQPRQEEP